MRAGASVLGDRDGWGSLRGAGDYPDHADQGALKKALRTPTLEGPTSERGGDHPGDQEHPTTAVDDSPKSALDWTDFA